MLRAPPPGVTEEARVVLIARNRAGALAEGALVALILVIGISLVGPDVPRVLGSTTWTSPEGTVISVDSAGTWTTDQIFTFLYATTLNTGHAIISRAVFVGLRRAVREMLALMNPPSSGKTLRRTSP